MSSYIGVDSDEETGESEEILTGRNGFVLLIDAGKEMFIKHENGKTHFQKCLECVKEIFLSIARKQKMDLVSVALYRTKESEGKHSPENVVLLQPLGCVTVTRIKALIDLLEENCESIKTKYGHADHYVLAHALHYCQTVLLESNRRMYVKNIILFTDNDDPYAHDQKLQYQSRKQAEEFCGHHIDFDVVGLGDFDSSKFYKELVLTSRGELLKDWGNRDPILSIASLMDQIDRLTEKYSLKHSYLMLNENLCLHVSLCKLFSEPKKFRSVKISEAEMEIIQTTSTKVVMDVDEDADDLAGGGKTVLAGETAVVGEAKPAVVEEAKPAMVEEPRSAVASIGQRSIPITRDEVKVMLNSKSNLKLGFNLLGFVNTDDVPLYFSRGCPYFMIPAGNHPNVRKVFTHLLNACVDRKKSMMGWFKLTRSSPPWHALLTPTLGCEYAEGKEHSAGFILSKLSFSEDLTEPDEADGSEAKPSQDQQEAANGIIKKLTIPYKVNCFSDHEVRFRTNMIEALALDYDDVVPVDDDTDPDLDGIAERLGDLCEVFNDCEHLGPEPSAKKTSYGNKAAKNASFGSNPLEMIQKGFANKLTIPQLKELLAQEGVKNLSSMNKAMLVSVANKRFGGPQ